VKYKKEHIKADGRRLTGSGPRDLQRRQQQIGVVVDNSDVIKELKNEINKLTLELRDRPVIGGFSGEQMDSEIRVAVTEAVGKLKKELKEKNDKLEKIKDKHVKEIKDLMREYSEKIEKLTASFIKSGTQKQDFEDDQQEEGRPKIQTKFIDPLEEDAGKTLEPFLDIKEDVSTNKDDNIFNKIDKLKGMLGKIPPK